MTTILNDEIPIPTSPHLIPVFLTFPSQAKSQRRINVEGLLDTGCLAGDFVARRTDMRFGDVGIGIPSWRIVVIIVPLFFQSFFTNGFLGAYVDEEELDASLWSLRSSCKSENLGIMSRCPKRFANRL